MNVKSAKLARQVRRIAAPGKPHDRHQRSQIKRSWAAMTHKERGERSFLWHLMIDNARVARGIKSKRAARAERRKAAK